MDKFIKLFLSKTHYKIVNINFETVNYYVGLNNSSCFIETSDGIKWHIKIGSNKEKSIANEISFLNKYWTKKFYKADNAFVKEIKKGQSVTIEKVLNNLKELSRVINEFHLQRDTLEVDYFKYLNPQLVDGDLVTFRSLLVKHKNQKIVLSHNDINLKNMLVNDNELFLVDFEWSKNNYVWFDIINFIREENLSLKQINDIIDAFPYLNNLQKTLEFLFINTFFSLTWAMQIEASCKKNKYLTKIRTQLDRIKTWIEDET